MSETAIPDPRVPDPQVPDPMTDRRAERRFASPVVGVAASRDGKTLAAATADGEVVLVPRDRLREPESWTVVTAHDGLLCFSEDCGPDSFLSGGEDGRLVRIFADGRTDILRESGKWIEHLAATPAHLAFSSGKQVEIREASGREALKVLDHPSTVSGLAFDGKGKRVACSHYNGVSLWFVQAKVDNPRAYEWKGSHIGVIVHPGGEAIITAMQENELHGWRLSDGHNMRMSGYPRKVRSMSFSRNGKWLATSGADAVVLWPFFGGGPMGKPPLEAARVPGVFVTAVRSSPKDELVAAGYDNGMVLLSEIGGSDPRILPLRGGEGDGAVTGLAFTPQGGALIFGTEEGTVGVVDLSAG